MKRINYFIIALAAIVSVTGCGQVSYKKTKSGLLYKIIPGKGKDSLIKEGQVVKFHYVAKLGDSVLYDSHDKLPGFAKVQPLDKPSYNLFEILTMMKKGDSAITIQLTDTLMKQQLQIPGLKKGERLITRLRIIEVFNSESDAMADYTKEAEKDRPRQVKQRMEEVAKQREKTLKDADQSGEGPQLRKVVEDYLAAKNIKAEKTRLGTYYAIAVAGTGPQASAGKYVTVKYAGRKMSTDSTFESGTLPPFQVGVGGMIAGLDEGVQQFREGGKGTLYIPGYLAYGKQPQPGSPFGPNEALIFDIEVIKVSDKPAEVQPEP
ncbi:MAG: FKBP-type peptidyl-prolyl cis-trans isomerase [Chitinophagaceae bacterium]